MILVSCASPFKLSLWSTDSFLFVRNDEKTAADYRVQGGSVLHLVLALRGGCWWVSWWQCYAINICCNLFNYCYGKPEQLEEKTCIQLYYIIHFRIWSGGSAYWAAVSTSCFGDDLHSSFFFGLLLATCSHYRIQIRCYKCSYTLLAIRLNQNLGFWKWYSLLLLNQKLGFWKWYVCRVCTLRSVWSKNICCIQIIIAKMHSEVHMV